MTLADLRALALSMPEAHEEPHFDRTSFRVGKKIFATATPDGREAMVRVHPVASCLALIESEPATFFSYGGWTERGGALGIRLARVDARFLRKLVEDSWARIAPKRKPPKQKPPKRKPPKRR